jgi:glycosyltransferase involved in cell wall biosynthesis
MLIVATSVTPAAFREEIASDKHPRLDYVELAARLGASYTDYNAVVRSPLARSIENRLRLDLQQAVQVGDEVRKHGHDVVASLSERVGIPLSFMLPQGVKHAIILVHPLSPQKLGLIRTLRVAARWDAAIVHSRAEAEVLRERLALDPDRVIPLHNSVDTRFFRPHEWLASDRGPDHILSAGLSYRDYPTLVQALRALPRVSCRIHAGSAWVANRSGLEGEAMPDNVRIHDRVQPSTLRERYARSRFVFVPIRETTQWSAGSTAVLEAQATGKAVIATRTPGMPDYVLDGETGLLVKGGSPGALTEAIDYLWNNPLRADTMGRRGREWVDATFSLDRWLDRFADVLTGLRIGRAGIA